MKYKPTAKQLEFLSWEFGVFFHFGIRSFNPGHVDWDNREMSAESFNPDSLDCEQWIKAIKDAGAKYAILTAKHHDGFANWPTKYSSFSVKQTPWKNGNGDVIKEYVDACRKFDIKVGIYYSPAQWGSSAVSFSDDREYDDYFINQITELLTDYGKIDYLWFDGCGSEGHEYDQKRIIKAIRTLQPEIIIFGMWDPDTVWAGNEDGYSDLYNDNVRAENVLGKKKTAFFPIECDCRIRNDWFYDLNIETLKSVDELIGMYEMSVGRGANFLLDIGPDNHGLLPNADVQRLMQLKSEIDKRYSRPLGFDNIEKVKENEYRIEYPQEFQDMLHTKCDIPLVNSVIIEENIDEGNAVKSFKIYANIPSFNPISDERICVYKGDTIGHKAICRFPALRSLRLTLEIIDSEENVKIKSMKAFE